MIWGSGGSKSRLAKAAGVEPAGQMRDEKLHAVVARSTFPSQKSKCTKRTRFGPLLEVAMSKKCTLLWREAHFKSKCTKHTMLGPLLEVEMVARSTFPSQNVQNTPCSDHFWKLRWWREAHFQVKMYKTHHARTTFGSSDVEKAHAVVARSTCRSEHVQNTRGSDHFWRFRCRKSARRCGGKHISKSKC